MVDKVYNLLGQEVGPRAADGPTTYGAHFSNTDEDGNWVVRELPTYADWLMQSLCSAHLEEKYQWGANRGLEDRLFITVEEWISLEDDVESYVGLPAHVVDLATKEMHAAGVFSMGGFEKIVEIDPGHEDYVAFAVSGYNGNFGSYDRIVEKRNEQYTRSDGQPYVKPQNIVPTRVYVGKKGLDEQGAPSNSFMARNGLLYGQLYGFAVDTSTVEWRDPWHKTAQHGDVVEGTFYPVNWRWDGQVRSFEHDASFDFQDAPRNTRPGSSWAFWTANGPDAGGAKTEHVAPTLDGRSAYIQTSTAGYFGEYSLDLSAALAGLSGNSLPDMIDSEYFLYQGETPVDDLIDLGGKGVRADGLLQTHMFDGTDKNTFEDIDGFEVISAGGKTYGVICEDGGNRYGERAFITELTKTGPMSYKFIAMSGGTMNTRMNAGVGVPAGTNPSSKAHEFSGTTDFAGMLEMSNGEFILHANDNGDLKHELEASVDINSHTMAIGLQAHNLIGGAIAQLGADRGGQWLIYQPDI